MKKLLSLLICVVGLSSLNAQTEKQYTKFRDNWSIGVNGGILTPFNHSAFFKNARATVGVDLNKQFSPVYGLTFENMWSINIPKTNATFDASNLMLLHRVNLNNMFSRYKGKPCVFEVEAVGGFGWLHVNDAYTVNGKDIDGNWVSSKAGLNLNFNVGEQKAWTIGFKPALVWDMTLSGKNLLNYNANQALWEITAGITYRFKNSNGKHYYSNGCSHLAEIAALNATIGSLEAGVADKNRALQNAQNAINGLQKELDDCRNRKPETKVVEVDNNEYVVTFRQGKSNVEPLQMAVIERLANYMNEHKDVKVAITGSASPEGSLSFNQKLSEKRAEAVKDILVKKYDISADRIDTKGVGVGTEFKTPQYNRASICVTK